MKIKIFYHAYLETYWKEILLSQIEEIVNSGLYDSVCEIKIRAIWKNEGSLKELENIIAPYKKIKLVSRNFWNNPPFGISFANYRVGRKFCKKEDGGERFEIQLGESETIMYLIEDSKKSDEDIKYLFLHTKGTHPGCITRQINGRLDERTDLSMPHGTANSLEVSLRMIRQWKKTVKELENYDWRGPSCTPNAYPTYGTSVNFWWINSSYAKKFDMQLFLKWQYEEIRRQSLSSKHKARDADGIWVCPTRITKFTLYDDCGNESQDFYMPCERHTFSMFPYKLEQALKGAKGVRI